MIIPSKEKVFRYKRSISFCLPVCAFTNGTQIISQYCSWIFLSCHWEGGAVLDRLDVKLDPLVMTWNLYWQIPDMGQSTTTYIKTYWKLRLKGLQVFNLYQKSHQYLLKLILELILDLYWQVRDLGQPPSSQSPRNCNLRP